MKIKTFLSILLIQHATLASCQQLTVDDIFDSYVETMGGLEHWRKLQSWERTSHRKSGLKVKSYAKKPDQFQLVFSRNEKRVIKSFDGQNGWLQVNGNYEPMRPGEEIEMAEEPEFYEDLIIAKEQGYELILEGEESLKGVHCHKIKMTKSASDPQWYWINKESYLLEMVGEYSEDPAHEGIFYTTRFEDYRMIDGYLIPFTEHLIRNGKDTTSIFYTEMIVNPFLEDEFFEYEPNDSRNCILWMQDEFSPGYLPEYTFLQETIIFENGTSDTSIWYEAISFPNQFRIDFKEPLGGNTHLFVTDTLHVFRDGEKMGKLFQPHEFLLIEGGIFSLEIDEVMSKLAEMNLDTNSFHLNKIGDQKALVIGSADGDLDKPQIWISKDHGKIMKSIGELNDGRLYEAQIMTFGDVGGYQIPLKIHFLLDGELIQTERYFEVDIAPEIPDDFFTTEKLSKEHWYKN